MLSVRSPGPIVKTRPVIGSPQAVVTMALLLTSGVAPITRADDTIYVQRGDDSWLYFRGLEDPSPGDADAWKTANYDDGDWTSGTAPFGYDDGPFGVDLAALVPPMEDNYSALFLRRRLDIVDASRVGGFEAVADYDDGFILWINGIEVLRANVSGDPPFNGFADSNHESGTYENFELDDPGNYLVSGENVIAAMVMNNQISSSDLKFDLELIDPFGPDLSPPSVSVLSPGRGATVRSLSQIEVRFNEEVQGVDAADLIVGGSPATGLSGAGAGPYTFSFPARPAGLVNVGWAVDPGIADVAIPANDFQPGANWSYTIDPDAPEAQLAIREFLASNLTGLKDEDGDAEDWIEVVNEGDEAVDVAGWALTDDPDHDDVWVFSGRSLDPGERLVVFASGKDRRSGGNLHTDFRMSADGEYLALLSGDSPRRVVTEFSPRFPQQRSDVSYGYDPSGALGYFATPTPGATNGASTFYDGFVAEPRASHPRGFYSSGFDLELDASTPGASIRYTLDGGEPTPSTGTVYNGAIRVEGSSSRAVVTVRAVAHANGWLPSKAVTYTYVFPFYVSEQPNRPAGFPTSWGSAPAVDYEMDPEIVNDGRYDDRMVQVLLQVPSISIVGSIADMFGSSGLYSNPGSSGVSSERPVSAELLYPDGREGFQVNCGARIHGGASRTPSKSPKHNLRLLFKGAYGPTKLRFPIFPDSSVDEFDTLILRANYNNSWVHWDSQQRSHAQSTRDQWVRDTQLAMSGLSSHGRFVHLYLNGLYWGLYNIVERPNADFASAHLGGEKEDYDAMNSGELVDGNSSAWNSLMSLAGGDLSTLARLDQVSELLDVPHFIDYMMVNFFGTNADWPSHNWYAVRKREPGAGWKFVSWDAERIFESVTSNNLNVGNGNSPGILWDRLRDNPEFVRMFGDRAHRHLFNGGALSPEGVRATWLARADAIDEAVIGESARWGDYRRDVHSSSNGPYEFYTPHSHWIPEQTRLLGSYFPQRTNTFLSQLRSANLYPSVAAPVLNQHGGLVDPGFQLTMTRSGSGTIYYTTTGEDPREYGSGDIVESASSYTAAITIADLTVVRARVRNGTNWSALTEATFTVSRDASALRISEIHYHPPEGPQLEFVELWNSGATGIDLSNARFTKGIQYPFPPGASLAGGRLLLLVSDRDAFEASYPGIPVDGVFLGQLANGGEKLTLKDENGATIVSVDYDDEGFWPIGADGLGHSLVIADPDGSPDSPDSWRASTDPGGSPRRFDPEAPHGAVVIHEVLARPTDAFEDAIELYNASSDLVDLGGWYLSDSRLDANSLKRFRIPDGTVLAPGGFAAFYATDFGGAGGFDLDANGGSVYLSAADSGGDLTGYVVGVEFAAAEAGISVGRYETSVGPDRASLERPTFGVDNPASVVEFRLGAGAENAHPRIGPAVINEIHYHPLEGGFEFIEIQNLTALPLELYDAGLGRGWILDGVSSADGTGSYEFPEGAVLGAGSYLLLVRVDPAFYRSVLGTIPSGVGIVGPYGGALDNGGEWLELTRPVLSDTGSVVHVPVDRVRYNDRDPWASEADGTGPSLERIFASEYGNDPINWAVSSRAGGTPGELNSATSGANQRPFASFTFAFGAEELSVLFDASASSDADGEIVEYAWDFGDGDGDSGPAARHVYATPGDYSVTLNVRDDRGSLSSAVRVVTVEFAGGQVPGDGNQDGELDTSDVIALLGYLFLGSPSTLPCELDSPYGTRALMDTNGDGFLDIGDGVFTLFYLFRPGAPGPVLGIECVEIFGCPEVCAP